MAMHSCSKKILFKTSGFGENIEPLVHSCSKKILFFYIPYTGQHGLQIRTQLHELLSKAYPHIFIRFVFRPTCRLFDFFPFKDRIPSAMRSHVVY